MESLEYNPKFLKQKYDLHNSPEVESARKRKERRTGESPVTEKGQTREEANIQNYLDRFKEIIEREDSAQREAGIQALKRMMMGKFVTKYEEIPESWFNLIKRILMERGQLGDWNRYPAEQKEAEKRKQVGAVLSDQEASLEQWIDYLSSDDTSHIPDYLKYWIIRNVVNLSEYDKDKKEFPQRSKGTVKMFPDINEEALSYVIDAVIEKLKGNNPGFGQFELDLIEEQKQDFRKGLENENFAKLYAWANEQIHSIPRHLLPVTEGEWVKYEKDDEHSQNYKTLNQSIRGRGTGWCTAGENTAKTQLQAGDFYVYYTLDDDQKPTIPRIAIRMEGDKIAEVRGIAYKQNLDPYMNDPLMEKLEEFPDKESYLKKDSDMKRLTGIYDKCFKVDRKTGEKTFLNPDLSKEELSFLYEKDDKITGFGYEDDPRIEEIKKERNVKNDLAVIHDCSTEQVAKERDEITEETRVYMGDLNKDDVQMINNRKNSLVVWGNVGFEACTSLASIPEGTVFNGYANFQGCTSLTSIPEGTVFKSDANFEACTSLASIPEGTVFNGYANFQGCTSLTSIPEGTVFNGDAYFQACTSLTSIPEGTVFKSDANFQACTSLASIPEGTVFKSDAYFKACTSLASIPEGTVFKGNANFEGCTSLTSIPEGTVFSGYAYFKGCPLDENSKKYLKSLGKI